MTRVVALLPGDFRHQSLEPETNAGRVLCVPMMKLATDPVVKLPGASVSPVTTIRSAVFPNVYLRMDGSETAQQMLAAGGGNVNCQFGVSEWEKFRIVSYKDGTVAIGSVAFANVFLRMDGNGVTQPIAADGGGTVNCQFGASAWERFYLLSLGDGIVSIGSVAFPNVFLRMDGRGVTQPARADGGGIVNCQFCSSAWERFRLDQI